MAPTNPYYAVDELEAALRRYLSPVEVDPVVVRRAASEMWERIDRKNEQVELPTDPWKLRLAVETLAQAWSGQVWTRG